MVERYLKEKDLENIESALQADPRLRRRRKRTSKIID